MSRWASEIETILKYHKDLRWNSKLQLLEHDAPELVGIVIVMSGATRAILRINCILLSFYH